MEKVISYQNVSINQSGKAILSNINFDIAQGEFIYLIGKTGSGKSTLMKTFYADLDVTEGDAMVCDFNLAKITQSEIPFLRRKLGIVFQDFQLLNNLTVYENLAFVLNATGWESKESVDNRIDEVLNEVGLPDKKNNYPKQMSGGEQQRLVVARALLNNPPVILADEPTGNLDPEMSDDIMRLLIRINREHNTAVLMATHNYQLIDRYPAKIFRCENHSVVEEKGIIM
jgi:cell division transport system ATP-binding protein